MKKLTEKKNELAQIQRRFKKHKRYLVWLGTFKKERMQIHGFCDASEKGYGAVIYSRVRINDKYQTELIASKSRVTPLRMTTIPRLELCSANLLVHLF